MERNKQLVCVLLLFSLCLFIPRSSYAAINQHVNARSAIVLDLEDGRILFEQNADYLIAPASITKILTLYVVFEAIKQGEISLSDKVEVSRRAASTGGSRMGLSAGAVVPMEELIKGIAVVSGNDACVAVAEHISGNVERFVKKMNAKARELGMNSSHFMTPNGLPAEGQVTTARDIARLSSAYLHRFPESLAIHSMQSYSYGRHTHHNANRLLGKCAGVDGLKTGFVCASGYNISATARRNHTRIVAVVMGARNAWIRCCEAEKLIEAGFHETGAPSNDVKTVAFTAPVMGKAAGTQGVRGLRRARGKKAGNHYMVASGDNAKMPVSTKVASNEKKTKNRAKKSPVNNSKAPYRLASAKIKSEKAVSGTKSAGVKPRAAIAKTTSKTRSKSGKIKREETKTAQKKKNSKGVPHANALRKRAKG
ncbi:Penicillin-binding protein 6. Serine peptidase. MEROPS family S11 [Syntrophobacter sp. SbD1]|nr:Penicillin-binding protein 6. Serine peptidase. MEROPS family S11 [Syntrophobacter sp. SbD1]